MSAPLPIWCANATGRTLILKLIAEQPGIRIDWGGGRWNSLDRTEQFAGRNAKALRDLYAAWLDEQLIANPRMTHDEREALIAVEMADALIARVLEESLALTEIYHIADGRIAA